MIQGNLKNHVAERQLYKEKAKTKLLLLLLLLCCVFSTFSVCPW